MQGLGRPDIVNAGSGETRYSKCKCPGWTVKRDHARPRRENCNSLIRGDQI
ncbi:unnamed protein product [Staurois parvus]|uniref:Uncharacterized protein n=1 Tax=Staurois parvus TaxID=386267 RepID=A0ABN9H2A1_9NEOB|nr:unnamed protein product [Staurois parvus]